VQGEKKHVAFLKAEPIFIKESDNEYYEGMPKRKGV
jgi:hypothetical protein